MTTTDRAIIIGGGIGGLATAIALKRSGVDALVFERADDLREVGAGLTLFSNAMKALDRLGLGAAIRAVSAPVEYSEIRSWRGDVLVRLPLGELGERCGAPSVAIHRADLQAALLAALGEGAVQLGATGVGFEQDDTGVTARFDGGREARGDLLIGADGIESMARARLFGATPLRYAGYTAWRGIAHFEHELLPFGMAFESRGCGARFGAVHIDEQRVYWFATQNTPESGHQAVAGHKHAVSDCFRGWHDPIEALIEATEEAAILRNPSAIRVA